MSDPLPGAPDPWAMAQMPPFRSRPPYLMTEMIAAEPAFAERLVRRLNRSEAIDSLAGAIGDAARRGLPIITTGCGTSEHGAIAFAELVNEALSGSGSTEVRATAALEVAARPPDAGLVIAISHEGGTRVTNQALVLSRRAGARTALVTVSDRSPAAALAEIVVTTEELDRSWCHTIGYLSPVIAGVVVAAKLAGNRLDARAIRSVLETSADPRAAAATAAGLTGIDRLIVLGSGADRASARELALKVNEGARLPAEALDVETVLHGYLAAATRWTGLVLIRADLTNDDDELADRSGKALRAARALNMPAAAIVAERFSADYLPSLTPAGRLELPRPGRVRGVAAGILGATMALQLLAERLARARGVDPDTLGREDAAQAAAHSGLGIAPEASERSAEKSRT